MAYVIPRFAYIRLYRISPTNVLCDVKIIKIFMMMCAAFLSFA